MRHTCRRVLTVLALTGLLSSAVATAAVAGGSPDGGKRERTYKGLTLGEWAAVWWQAVLATETEAGSHPLTTGGAFGGANHTVFLSAPVAAAGTPRTRIPVTIPAETYLVVPIITVECSVAEEPPFHGDDEPSLRGCANGLLDAVSAPDATIDGRPVKNPEASRVESPLFRYGPLTAANALGLAPGTQSDAVGAGYFLLLPPLSVGMHRIVVRADVAAFGLAVDAAFIVYVKPQGW